jgi:hypothetical protein
VTLCGKARGDGGAESCFAGAALPGGDCQNLTQIAPSHANIPDYIIPFCAVDFNRFFGSAAFLQ